MSRIGGIINEMNNRTFFKERQINNRFIDLLNKQRIIALTLDKYEGVISVDFMNHVDFKKHFNFIIL